MSEKIEKITLKLSKVLKEEDDLYLEEENMQKLFQKRRIEIANKKEALLSERSMVVIRDEKAKAKKGTADFIRNLQINGKPPLRKRFFNYIDTSSSSVTIIDDVIVNNKKNKRTHKKMIDTSVVDENYLHSLLDRPKVEEFDIKFFGECGAMELIMLYRTSKFIREILIKRLPYLLKAFIKRVEDSDNHIIDGFAKIMEQEKLPILLLITKYESMVIPKDDKISIEITSSTIEKMTSNLIYTCYLFALKYRSYQSIDFKVYSPYNDNYFYAIKKSHTFFYNKENDSINHIDDFNVFQSSKYGEVQEKVLARLLNTKNIESRDLRSNELVEENNDIRKRFKYNDLVDLFRHTDLIDLQLQPIKNKEDLRFSELFIISNDSIKKIHYTSLIPVSINNRDKALADSNPSPVFFDWYECRMAIRRKLRYIYPITPFKHKEIVHFTNQMDLFFSILSDQLELKRQVEREDTESFFNTKETKEFEPTGPKEKKEEDDDDSIYKSMHAFDRDLEAMVELNEALLIMESLEKEQTVKIYKDGGIITIESSDDDKECDTKDEDMFID